MAEERLQKVLAHAGIASRREAETMIEAGRVAVDGTVVRELGTKVDTENAKITVDGRPIRSERLEYWAVHKPVGVITTVDDPEGRRTARSLVPTKARVYPVGRLDADSSGLLLFTNDGELTNRLTHPRYGHAKIYRVLVGGYPGEDVLEQLRKGVMLDDGPTAPARIEAHHTTATGTWLEITLRQGRKRQIRRMIESVGYTVGHLTRIAIGPVKLGSLESGSARPLTTREVRILQHSTGLDDGKAGGRGKVGRPGRPGRTGRGARSGEDRAPKGRER